MECMNPGGTGKDRAAKYMLQDAMRKHKSHFSFGTLSSIVPPPAMFEGTSGSTGIALACLCNAMSLKLHVVMPDDQADEKRFLLERLGVTVTVVPCCGISNKGHYVNTAKRMAAESGGVFLDQFENIANFQAHYDTTGPEIWKQTNGEIDAFVMSAGTGGTIAGVSR
jgi:cysteine synthase